MEYWENVVKRKCDNVRLTKCENVEMKKDVKLTNYENMKI